LIELLVAMSILALLILILQSVFTISLRGWRKADNVLQVATIARITLERMSREISSSIVKGSSVSYACLGFDQVSQSGWKSGSLADEFFFIAPLNPGVAEYSDLCEVGYWLGTDGDGQTVLKRHYARDDRRDDPGSPDFDFSFQTGRNDEFSHNISGLQFIFYDDAGNSFLGWDSTTEGGSPAKIKITITVNNGTGSAATNPDFMSKDFSTMVSLVN